MPRSRLNPDPIVTLKGSTLNTISTAATVLSLKLDPTAIHSWLTNESDGYQEFRFTDVKVTLYANSTADHYMVGYMPTLATTDPTAAQIMEGSISAVGNGFYGTPFPTIHVGRNELSSNISRWFRRGSGYDDLLENQGVIYFGSTTAFNTKNAYYWIRYTIQLRGRVNASVTLARPQVEVKSNTERAVVNRPSSSLAVDDGDKYVLVPKSSVAKYVEEDVVQRPKPR